MKQYAIQPATLEFNAEGTPVSRDFDDVYFSNDNGLEETRYVFLGGNRLAERFPVHSHPLFIVAESGFGTGLNFLTLWQAFDSFRSAHPQATLQRLHFISFEKFPLTRDDLALAHQHWPELAPWFYRSGSEKRETAIIGGGIASALLSLALLRRGWQVTLYCADDQPAQGASGNRQGALYPLLSKHDAAINRFFPTAFTFARRLYDALPVSFDHDWCGVTQLGWDEKSQQKITQMLSLALPAGLASALNAEEAEQAVGVTTRCGGITYPAGSWLCPEQLTRAVIALATEQGLQTRFRHTLTSLVAQESRWQLRFTSGETASHETVVLANGHQINRFDQTQPLPVYAVGGQVSHIPTTPALSALRQVLCYDGYLTPQNPHNQQHCIGASYHRGDESTVWREEDQRQNRQRLLDCFPDAKWATEVDVSGNSARCGVRCATRDHLPMVGNVPDYHATLTHYADLADNKTSAAPAPVYPGLFVLGALGSRGLCSAPLCAEILAAQMSNEPIPLDASTLAALNPNRLWVRKLLKGKAVK